MQVPSIDYLATETIAPNEDLCTSIILQKKNATSMPSIISYCIVKGKIINFASRAMPCERQLTASYPP